MIIFVKFLNKVSEINLSFRTIDIPGIVIIEPKVFSDERGFFFETFKQELYEEAGMTLPFVQDNTSRSTKGVLRGLHYQLNSPQGKLVTVLRGAVLDVMVDIRQGSPTFSKSFSIVLDDENHKQVYVPPGFAHGFCVLSDEVDFYYKCTDYYNPSDEYGLLWNDELLDIEWPSDSEPALSDKDTKHPLLHDIPAARLPKFEI